MQQELNEYVNGTSSKIELSDFPPRPVEVIQFSARYHVQSVPHTQPNTSKPTTKARESSQTMCVRLKLKSSI